MHYYFFLRLENFRFKIFFFLHINKKNSQGKISQMNLDLENMNNNLSQENSTPVPVSDDNDSLSIVDLCLDNRAVTETSAGDVAETSARGVKKLIMKSKNKLLKNMNSTQKNKNNVL